MLSFLRRKSLDNDALAQGIVIEASRSHLDTPHLTEPLRTNDQPDAETSTWPYRKHSQDIHDPGGIRTCNPSKRKAVDPRLRPRGHSDRPEKSVIKINHQDTYHCDKMSKLNVELLITRLKCN